MSHALIVLAGKPERARAAHLIATAPANTRVEFKGPKRTLPQNDKMWAMLTDVARQKDWHGARLAPTDFKKIFTAALKRELRLVPNIDNDGFVQLGDSTSDMGKEDMAALLELIAAKGAEWGVEFTEPQEAAA